MGKEISSIDYNVKSGDTLSYYGEMENGQPDGMKKIVKNVTEQWTANGISGGQTSQSQYAQEKGSGD